MNYFLFSVRNKHSLENISGTEFLPIQASLQYMVNVEYKKNFNLILLPLIFESISILECYEMQFRRYCVWSTDVMTEPYRTAKIELVLIPAHLHKNNNDDTDTFTVATFEGIKFRSQNQTTADINTLFTGRCLRILRWVLLCKFCTFHLNWSSTASVKRELMTSNVWFWLLNFMPIDDATVNVFVSWFDAITVFIKMHWNQETCFLCGWVRFSHHIYWSKTIPSDSRIDNRHSTATSFDSFS